MLLLDLSLFGFEKEIACFVSAPEIKMVLTEPMEFDAFIDDTTERSNTGTRTNANQRLRPI